MLPKRRSFFSLHQSWVVLVSCTHNSLIMIHVKGSSRALEREWACLVWSKSGQARPAGCSHWAEEGHVGSWRCGCLIRISSEGSGLRTNLLSLYLSINSTDTNWNTNTDANLFKTAKAWSTKRHSTKVRFLLLFLTLSYQGTETCVATSHGQWRCGCGLPFLGGTWGGVVFTDQLCPDLKPDTHKGGFISAIVVYIFYVGIFL